MLKIGLVTLIIGTINGTEGVYHITTKGDLIIHRAFVPVTDWTRYSGIHDLPLFDNIPPLK